MGIIGWSTVVLHIALFIYMRKRYLKKARNAENEAANFKVKYLQASEENATLRKILGQ